MPFFDSILLLGIALIVALGITVFGTDLIQDRQELGNTAFTALERLKDRASR